MVSVIVISPSVVIPWPPLMADNSVASLIDWRFKEPLPTCVVAASVAIPRSSAIVAHPTLATIKLLAVPPLVSLSCNPLRLELIAAVTPVACVVDRAHEFGERFHAGQVDCRLHASAVGDLQIPELFDTLRRR